MKNLSIAAIIASSLITTCTLATAATPPATAKDQLYISGDIGHGTLATPDENFVEPDGITIIGASHRTGGLAAGSSIGYQHAVTPHALIGAEFGYDHNGNARYTESYPPNLFLTSSTLIKIGSTDTHILATGTYLFNNGFNIFAKAGAARVDQTLKVKDQVYYWLMPVLLAETSIVQYKPMAAAGMGYRFKMVDIYGQYSHIFGANTDNFSDLINSDGSLSQVVSVDIFKIGASVAIHI